MKTVGLIALVLLVLSPSAGEQSSPGAGVRFTPPTDCTQSAKITSLAAYLRLSDAQRRLVLTMKKNCLNAQIQEANVAAEDAFIQAFGWSRFEYVTSQSWSDRWKDAATVRETPPPQTSFKREEFAASAVIWDRADVTVPPDLDPPTYESIHFDPVAYREIPHQRQQARQFVARGEARIFEGFPQHSVTVKAIWRRIPAGGEIRVGVWPGAAALSHPDQRQQMKDWPGCVWVVAENRFSSGRKSCGMSNGQPVMGNVTSSREFYSYTVTDPAKIPISFRISRQLAHDLRSGDTMILLGMHIATKEIPDWTWSTFWWQPGDVNDPQKPARLSGDPRWKHFAGRTALSLINPRTPAGENPTASAGGGPLVPVNTPYKVIFNPYLEATDLPWGTLSNCITCHARASLHGLTDPFDGGDVQDACRIDAAGNAVPRIATIRGFEGKTTTDYVWSLFSQ